MVKEYLKVKDDGTYDEEAIRKAALEEAQKIIAKEEAKELFDRTYEDALKKREDAKELYESTLNKKLKRKKKKEGEGEGKVGRFLQAFGNWSQNVQDQFNNGGF